jgi:hypothetical protein
VLGQTDSTRRRRCQDQHLDTLFMLAVGAPFSIAHIAPMVLDVGQFVSVEPVAIVDVVVGASSGDGLSVNAKQAEVKTRCQPSLTSPTQKRRSWR